MFPSYYRRCVSSVTIFLIPTFSTSHVPPRQAPLQYPGSNPQRRSHHTSISNTHSNSYIRCLAILGGSRCLCPRHSLRSSRCDLRCLRFHGRSHGSHNGGRGDCRAVEFVNGSKTRKMIEQLGGDRKSRSYFDDSAAKAKPAMAVMRRLERCMVKLIACLLNGCIGGAARDRGVGIMFWKWRR